MGNLLATDWINWNAIRCSFVWAKFHTPNMNHQHRGTYGKRDCWKRIHQGLLPCFHTTNPVLLGVVCVTYRAKGGVAEEEDDDG